MKILTIVPSKQRVEEFERYTWRWLQHIESDYVIMLEESDVSDYCSKLGIPKENIISLSQSNQGLGYSLMCASIYAKDSGYEAIFKIDDDVNKFRKRKQPEPESEEEGTKQRVENFKYALKLVDQILSENKQVGAVGFPYDNQMYETSDFSVNKKLQTCYAVRLDLYNPIPEISSQEDYYAYINVRKAGYKTVRLDNLGISLGIDVGQGDGGLQSKDLMARQESAKKEVQLLQKMFPGLAVKKKEGTAWGYEIDFRRSKL